MEGLPSKQQGKKRKKPFHIKRSDLDLDGYRKEIQDQSPTYLVQRALTALKVSRQFHLFVGLQVVAAFFGYGQVMLCIGML
jgi:hypothetical protein